MRSLRDILALGDPTPEEQIVIRRWIREYPRTDIAGRLAEKFPVLASREAKPEGQR